MSNPESQKRVERLFNALLPCGGLHVGMTVAELKVLIDLANDGGTGDITVIPVKCVKNKEWRKLSEMIDKYLSGS